MQDVGQRDDGRFTLALWAKGSTRLVCFDVFAATPVVTVEPGELPIAAEPGFVRAAGAALRGTSLLAVRPRKNDRLLRLEFGSRSRFGVEDGYSLVCELVPRFGNLILLKGETIVAAAKEFAPADNAVRSIQAGDAYEAPPLRPGKSSPLLEENVTADLGGRTPEGPLHVYRRGGALVQVHLTELPQFAELAHEQAASLLDLLDEARRSHANVAQNDQKAKRRRGIERALHDREKKLLAETAQVDGRLREAAGRETLREQGEAIYATLHEVEAHAQEEAKERAAAIFARYKKAASAVTHLERRRSELSAALADVADLRWELERAADAEVDDVAQAVAALEPRHGSGPQSVARKRKPLQFATPSGSRIFVGRTPIENADLTFRVARPDDLWFHVQNQPGAHVILQRDDKAPAPHADVLYAASLAALHSKAKNSPKVTVDYTHRKHVRKRPSAAPGLVFYTHPKSVHVSPNALPFGQQ